MKLIITDDLINIDPFSNLRESLYGFHINILAEHAFKMFDHDLFQKLLVMLKAIKDCNPPFAEYFDFLPSNLIDDVLEPINVPHDYESRYQCQSTAA